MYTLRDMECKKIYTFVDININEKKFYYVPVHESGQVQLGDDVFPIESPHLLFICLVCSSSRRPEQYLRTTFLELFRIAAFSSDPLQEDCIFIPLNNSHVFVSISTCRGWDNAWRTHHFECDFPLHEVNHVVYVRGIFYCPNSLHGGTIGTYNAAEQNWAVLEPERSTLTTYRDMCLWHVHRVKTDHSDGELCLVLIDHSHSDGLTFRALSFPVMLYPLVYHLWHKVDLGMNN